MSKKLFNLDDDVIGLLQDFCEANYGAREVRIVNEAVRFFVTERLQAEPELRKRFEAARESRLGENVHRLQITN